jgi:hypothetical protein
VAEDSGFRIDLEQTIGRRRQRETAPPECRGHGHQVTVLEKGMGTEVRHNGGHFNNVRDAERTGNPQAPGSLFADPGEPGVWLTLGRPAAS